MSETPTPTGDVVHLKNTYRLDIDNGPVLVDAISSRQRRILVDRLDIDVSTSYRDGGRTRRVYARVYGHVLRKDGTPGAVYTDRTIHNPSQSDTIGALADVIAAAGIDMTEVNP